MYFWDEDKEILVENCPSCQVDFGLGGILNCSFSCSAKKLEVKHKKVTAKMINFCLPKQEIKINFLPYVPNKKEYENFWGWTNDTKGIINFPLWTLRSEREFLDTIAHESAHITAFEKKFTLNERKVLKKLVFLEEQEEEICYNSEDFDKLLSIREKIEKTRKINNKIVKKYLEWDGHEDEPWYSEYQRLHKKLVNSPFVKYAYGYVEPYPPELVVKNY